MPRDGFGNYTLPAPDIANGQTSDATDFNLKVNDIAAALTDSISSDGQTPSTANQDMGNFRHINVADAQMRNEYSSAGQIQDGKLTYLTGVAGTNTITANAPLAMNTYVAGQSFRFTAAGANTGAVTININAIGAKAITKNGNTALVAGDIPVGSIVDIDYDGTQFQATVVTDRLPLSGGTLTGTLNTALVNEKHGADIASAATINLTTATGNLIVITGNVNISSITLADGAERTVSFASVLTLVESATLKLCGNFGNILTASGDTAIFRGYSTFTKCMFYQRQNGQAVIAPSVPSFPLTIANGGTGGTTGPTAITALGLNPLTVNSSIAFQAPGGVVTIFKSHNCTISYLGSTGNYRIAFTFAQPDVYYKIFGSGEIAGTGLVVGFLPGGVRTTVQCDIIIQDVASVVKNPDYFTLCVVE